MILYLVRHTRVAIPKDLFYGQTDVPLADTFEEESEIVKNDLKDIYADAVFSSPLKRCRKLAEKIVDANNIIFDDRLKELNFGDWEMKSWNELKGTNIDNWYNNFVSIKCPNGESFEDLRNRALDFYNDLQKTNYSNVLIFTHSGFIRASISILKKINLQDTFKSVIDYGSVMKFDSDKL